MIDCDKCGFGYKTFDELRACKSWDEMEAERKAAERVTQATPPPHKTIRMKVWADIDAGIASAVEQLQGMEGVTTHTSCQGGETYPGYVMVTWRDADVLVELQKEFSVEMLGEGWGYARQHAEHVREVSKHD